MQKGWGRGEGGASQSEDKGEGGSSYTTPTKDYELSRQLKYQQHQIDALVGKVKDLVSVVKATQPSSRMDRTGVPSYGRGAYGTRTSGRGGGGFWRKGQSSQPGATPQSKSRNPQQGQGTNRTNKQYPCWQCGEVGYLKRDCPTLKGKGLSSGMWMALSDRKGIPQMNSKMSKPIMGQSQSLLRGWQGMTW